MQRIPGGGEGSGTGSDAGTVRDFGRKGLLALLLREYYGDIADVKRFPKLKIAGMYAPPFRPLNQEEDEAVIRRINEARPDFIWVGLGAPKQENWMAAHEGRVYGVMLGVGAGFDFHAGTIKRAPKWMQEMCLEWLYRIFQDPGRLIGRYLDTNFSFLWYLWKEW